VNTPVVTVTATPAAENGGDGSFQFELHNPDGTPFIAQSDMPISYTLSGSATSGVNFADPGSIVIAAGTSSVSATVHALDDNHASGMLDTTLTLNSTGNYIGDTTPASCHITDGDTRTVSVDSPTFDAGGSATLHVTVTGNFSGVVPLTLSYPASALNITPDGDPTLTDPNTEVQTFTVSADAPGSFDVTATDSAQNQGGGTVTVNDAPADAPVIAGIDATVASSWTGLVATFTAADHNVGDSYYTAVVDYGDGTTPQTATVSGSNGSDKESGTGPVFNKLLRWKELGHSHERTECQPSCT
jgi:hypothetical protein